MVPKTLFWWAMVLGELVLHNTLISSTNFFPFLRCHTDHWKCTGVRFSFWKFAAGDQQKWVPGGDK